MAGNETIAWAETAVQSQYGGIFVHRYSADKLTRETWVFIKDPHHTYDTLLPLVLNGYTIAKRATRRHKFDVAIGDRWARIVENRTGYMTERPAIPDVVAGLVIAEARASVRIVEPQ